MTSLAASVDQARPGAERPAATARLEFTGTEGEYFRLWCANALLTLLTFGVYSAWAKVRQARWFCQNTRLDGFAFDYHGNPLAILRGRVLALLLVGVYSLGFTFSPTVGFAGLGVVAVLAPWLLYSALRFTLTNTSWRGLRFGLRSPPAEAYLVGLPIIVVWVGLVVVIPLLDRLLGLIVLPLAGLAFPWMHHRLKSYQQERATFGDEPFSFDAPVESFYAAYGLSTLAVLGVLVPFLILTALGFRLTVVVAPAAVLVWWAVLTAKLQAAVWKSTSTARVRFDTDIDAATSATVSSAITRRHPRR